MSRLLLTLAVDAWRMVSGGSLCTGLQVALCVFYLVSVWACDGCGLILTLALARVRAIGFKVRVRVRVQVQVYGGCTAHVLLRGHQRNT